MLVDSHAHIDLPAFADDVAAVFSRCREAGVLGVVNIRSPFEPDRREAVAEAAGLAGVAIRFTEGVHPHDASRFAPSVRDGIERRLASCAALGEVGLDYHYMHSPKEDQRRVFREQVDLARKHGKPLVIHSREADQDTLAVLADGAAHEVGGVIHCFTGGPELASGALLMGFCISFSGIVTFRKADRLREIARTVPEDRLLVETDAPYLTPEPHRGKRNEPAHVRLVVEALAAARSSDVAAVANATAQNASRLFGMAEA